MSNFNIIIIIIYVSTLAILLSLFSNKIRKIIYGSLISTILPFSITLIQNIQFGFNGMVIIIEKWYCFISLLFDRSQIAFENEKELFFLFINLHNEFLNVIGFSLKEFYFNIKLAIFNLYYLVKNTIISVKNIIIYKASIEIRRINLSKQLIYFRL